ncbi:TPA: hypothetical protein ACF1RY_002853 [Enterococcus hirae]|uniref:hypothetical protein n=1 Tax=Enterococcus TaxID=1350 RepID=UPI000CF30A2C|nr:MULTISPECIES: hypothetical protein [Enterococcus]PQG95659.1 hypothetical protein CUS55_04315 [Enterococcus faecium]RBT55584.1 hypothetical protein EB24_00761 [Enterococcus hirae]RBT70867.1 hypothetical protein EA82_00776 [Enterococcus hirae]
MKKIVFSLVFSSLILGACGGNNASSESSTSMSDDTTESSLRQKISDLKSENEELKKKFELSYQVKNFQKKINQRIMKNTVNHV